MGLESDRDLQDWSCVISCSNATLASPCMECFRIREPGGGNRTTVYYEPPVPTEPTSNVGYIKINSMQLLGYSVHFDPEAIQGLESCRSTIPYTQGSQDFRPAAAGGAALQSEPALSLQGPHTQTCSPCLLRHRLKLSSADVSRILTALQDFSSRQPNHQEYEANKLSRAKASYVYRPPPPFQLDATCV
uniref:BRINP C-terminal domain-containing protein n=1 Tax=Knipowitschia caucasica TaxID=637954 RepID=A0AAV2JQX0_KNICA